MAPVSHVLRTSPYYYLLFVLVLHCADSVRGDLSVSGAECSSTQCRYVVRVPGGTSWRLTSEGGAIGDDCRVFSQEYDIRELPGGDALAKDGSIIEVTVPVSSGRLFFCRYEAAKPLSGRWIHQGTNVFLDLGAEQSTINTSGQQMSDLSQTAPVSERADSEIAGAPQKQNNGTKTDSAQANLDIRKNNLEDIQNVVNNLETDNLISKDNWIDLSHDIDVNNEPGAARPTREEADDILVLTDADQYVPLSEVNSEFGDEETNDYAEQLDVQLPEADDDVKRIRELGASDREQLEEDNTIVDLIETALVRREATEETASEITVLLKSAKSDGFASVKDVGDRQQEEDNTIVDLIEGAPVRRKREATEETTSENPEITSEAAQEITPAPLKSARSDDFTSVRGIQPLSSAAPLRIEGMRVEHSAKPPEYEDGIPSVLSNAEVRLRVFGTGFTENMVISFTHEPGEYGTPCPYRLKGEYPVKAGSVKDNTAVFEFTAPAPVSNYTFYFCATNQNQAQPVDFVHQGSDGWVILMTHNKPLPLWATLLLILVCLMFSALFSGLNLGLMSLDRTELKIIANTGTETERKYARAIQPVRDHGNYLLCSILLGNVAVNSTFTILLDDLMSGLFAVIFSTLAIVCLGEIVPQAICSRHGLMIGAKSIVVTKAVMGMTAPLAYPVSKLLDYFLGEEIGNVYNRERLKELVKVTNDINDLDKDEVNIISGALEMRKKTVSEVMTKIEDVFMLSSDSVLDFETMSEIIKSGFSRIPVYEGTRSNIVTVLFIKDLAFVDPDDNTPLKTLCQFYQNPCNFVFEDTTLDIMFRMFKEGHKGHMAFVHRVNNEGEGDPFYETIGLVTLEDVIEEMIQAEIVDETDVFTDNRSKRRRNRPGHDKLTDFAAFAERRENQRIRISPQLTLATFQFLSSSVDAFRPDVVSETVLRRLLRQDIIHMIKCKGKDKSDPSTLVYQQGKPVDYFVLIVEGRVEVTVGRENLVFEAGPFTYFGVQALTQNIGIAESPTPSMMGSLQNINMDAMLRYTFVPDYSVRAITQLFYIVIKRSLYLAAKRATLMEKTSSLTKGGVSAGDQFDSEVDKSLSAAGPSRKYVAKKFTTSRSSLADSSEPETPPETDSRRQSYRGRYSLDRLDSPGTSKRDPIDIPSDRSLLEGKLFSLELELMGIEQRRLEEESKRIEMDAEVLLTLRAIWSMIATKEAVVDVNVGDELLQSLDEDGSVSDHRTPSRQISPNLPPSSATHQTRSSFASAAGSPVRPTAAPASPARGNNGDVTYKFPPGQQIETDEK